MCNEEFVHQVGIKKDSCLELKNATCLHVILLLTSRYLRPFVRSVHAKTFPTAMP